MVLLSLEKLGSLGVQNTAEPPGGASDSIEDAGDNGRSEDDERGLNPKTKLPGSCLGVQWTTLYYFEISSQDTLQISGWSRRMGEWSRAFFLDFRED